MYNSYHFMHKPPISLRVFEILASTKKECCIVDTVQILIAPMGNVTFKLIR